MGIRQDGVLDLFILGISGFKQSGKDTIADGLIVYDNFHKIALAHKIKEICQGGKDAIQAYMPWVTDEDLAPFSSVLPWDGVTKTGLHRKLLQQVGTEMGRSHTPDIWLNALDDYLEKLYHSSLPLQNSLLKIVVPDVRFISSFAGNEMRGLLNICKKWSHGNAEAVFWRVNRPGFKGDFHKSEVELNGKPYLHFDATLDNVGTITDLQIKANLFYDLIKEDLCQDQTSSKIS